MPSVPVAPPQPVPVFSGLDYVTVDAVAARTDRKWTCTSSNERWPRYAELLGTSKRNG
jgi:hypothetical protein